MSWPVRWWAIGMMASTSLAVAHALDQPRPEAPRAPTVFGAGVLSVGEIYRGCFAADGNTFYFFRKVGEPERFRIVVSHRSGTTWTRPQVVDLGGDFSDLYPALSGDGKRLFFSSYRPVPGAAGGKPNAHLWYADRTVDGWGAPVFIATASAIGHYHSWVQVGFDGRLYFRRTTPDWSVTVTMASGWNGREYDTPQPYEPAERWKGWRADVDVVGGSPGPDGSTVFLDVATRNPATGRGASDIWVSTRQGDSWVAPRRLGAGVNSDGYDVFPFFSADGRDLYFVRDFTTFYTLPLREALASTAP